MLIAEQEEKEEEERIRKEKEEADKKAAEDAGNGLLEGDKINEEMKAKESQNLEEIKIQTKGEIKDFANKDQIDRNTKRKDTVKASKAQTNKNIEKQKREPISRGQSIERNNISDHSKPKLANEQPSQASIPNNKLSINIKDESRDYRLIKMQSGESIYNIVNPGNNFQLLQKPEPKISALKPEVNTPIDNPLKLDSNQTERGLMNLSKTINDNHAILGKNSQTNNGNFKVLNSVPGTKKTTANEPSGAIQVSKISREEIPGEAEPRRNTLGVFTKPASGNLNHDPAQQGFSTIREMTEPEASGFYPKSHRQTLDLPSKAAKPDILGEESINIQLSANPQSDNNLMMLRQNLVDRHEVIAKPNFSCSLIGKDILQIIAMEDEKQRREENNKEIVMLETKKYEELFDMVRTETFTHSQTTPARVAGGWMEYEATGASTKAQDI